MSAQLQSDIGRIKAEIERSKAAPANNPEHAALPPLFAYPAEIPKPENFLAKESRKGSDLTSQVLRAQSNVYTE